MMKGFAKNGKWLGLMLALGLLFAGCVTGGDDSSSEDAVKGPTPQDVNGVVVTIDPMAKTMTVGDGDGPAVISVGGHTVGLQNGTTTATVCSGSGAEVNCWITVINMDPDELAYNVDLSMTCLTGATCAAGIFDNADFSGAVDIVGTAIGDPGASAPVDGAKFCIVEEGVYPSVFPGDPGNDKGCNTWPTAGGSNKPQQIIHPKCGARSLIFDFGGQDKVYKFLVTMTASWYPWAPVGNADYDWTDRSTFYVMVNALNDPAGLANKAWYRIGSSKRSTTLSGWNAGGTDLGAAPMIPGQYFGVTVAVDYANRAEDRIVGDKWRFNLNPCVPGSAPCHRGYEYSNQISYILRFEPAVAKLVVTANKLLPSGSRVAGGITNAIATALAAGNNLQEAWDLRTKVTSQGYNWIASAERLPATALSNFAGGVYKSDNGGSAAMSTYNTGIPKQMGHKGIAKVRTGGPLTSGMTGTAVVVQQGQDAAPDLFLRQYYFGVNLGTVGKGSEFWIDTFAGYTGFEWIWTNTTIAGGKAAGTDDWIGYCWPMDPAKLTFTDKGCPSLSATPVLKTDGERANAVIPNGGRAVAGFDGAYQQWPAHICVQ